MWGAGKKSGLPAMGGGEGVGVEQLSPERYPGHLKDVAFGRHHAAYVSAEGKVLTLGTGKKNELGLGGATTAEEPTEVTGLSDVVQVSCGKHHTAALTAGGEVYTWGCGGTFFNPGALGHGNRKSQEVPLKIESLEGTNIVQLASGDFHVVALTDEGKMLTWGKGEYGVLGTGSSSSALSPVEVLLADVKIKKVQCGQWFTAAVSEEGDLYVWGANDKGQLGLAEGFAMDMNNMESIPTKVDGFDDMKVLDVACGATHTLALTEDHNVWIFGNGQWLQPFLCKGDDGTLEASTVQLVAGGNLFSLAADGHGHLFSWGKGKSACLGTGNNEDVAQPLILDNFGPIENGNELGPVVKVVAGYSRVAVFTQPNRSPMEE
jgi:alpha-tubulin suppressor-like RCC1 family protein